LVAEGVGLFLEVDESSGGAGWGELEGFVFIIGSPACDHRKGSAGKGQETIPDGF
jgi:hypothetical protein